MKKTNYQKRKARPLEKHLSHLLRKWIIEKWENHKDELSMTDIALIFGKDLSFIYRTIKKWESNPQ